MDTCVLLHNFNNGTTMATLFIIYIFIVLPIKSLIRKLKSVLEAKDILAQFGRHFYSIRCNIKSKFNYIYYDTETSNIM